MTTLAAKHYRLISKRRTVNWQMIGAIGEIGGAIAVVLTLGYLARQVRDSASQDRRRQSAQSPLRFAGGRGVLNPIICASNNKGV